MESSQWENLNHRFCRKVSFVKGHHLYSEREIKGSR
jgi:hypothetical protein